MPELNKPSPEILNEVAFAAGKQVIAKAVEMAIHVIDETVDPSVRADLETEFHDKLLESGVPLIIPAQENPNPDHRTGNRTKRTRDEVIIDTTRIFWARQRGMLPRPKKQS
jgi:hypothetical protein